MTLTRAEMADLLHHEMGLNKTEAGELVDAFFEHVRACLEAGEDVQLSGFGSFRLRDKGARPGRNLQTGEEIRISARRVVVFRPARKLRARVRTPAEEAE